MGPLAQLGALFVAMVLFNSLPAVGEEVAAFAAAGAVAGLATVASVSRRRRGQIANVGRGWWGRLGFSVHPARVLLPAVAVAVVVGVGEVAGAIDSHKMIFPAAALGLGVVGGLSVLPSSPMRLDRDRVVLWGLVAIVQATFAVLIVLMAVAVGDWLAAGTLYIADVAAALAVSFAFALAGVMISGWYISRAELARPR